MSPLPTLSPPHLLLNPKLTAQTRNPTARPPSHPTRSLSSLPPPVHHPPDNPTGASRHAASISSLARSHRWSHLLSSFSSMLSDGSRPDKFLLPKILKACSELRAPLAGATVHSYMIRIQLSPDVFVNNSLIDMYSKCGDLDSSRLVFDRMPERDVVSWTALLNAYSTAGLLDDAVDVFNSMRENGVRPDLICWNALISGHARSGDIGKAARLMEEMAASALEPGVNSWNGIISGCVQNGLFETAAFVFRDMCSRVRPNGVTVASVLPACSGLGGLSLGRELHCYVIRSGIKTNVYVGGSLIDMYLKCGMKEYAERVFSMIQDKNTTICNEMIAAYVEEDEIGEALELLVSMKEGGLEPDVVTYNTFLAAYARKGKKQEAFELMSEMSERGLRPNVVSVNALISGFHRSGLNTEALRVFRTQFSEGVSVRPNAVSVTSLLSVCTDLQLRHLGKEIHGYVTRNEFESSIFVSSALVDMYARCEEIDSAKTVFDGITDKNVVSWNVLMAGHNHNGNPEAALKLFTEMLEESTVPPNSVTLMILLLACSNTAALSLGKELHGYIEKQKPDDYPVALASGLISMYAKCGSIGDARLVFDCADRKDVAVWNAMISGYSLHGMGTDAIDLFEDMEASGIKPDRITFAALLSACAQEGLVDEGWNYFYAMEAVYDVAPTLEHFTCMVDITSTAGLLEESLDFVRRMPFEPDACVWATLLKACKLHSNYEVGEKAARALFELEPTNVSNYIVLSNIFAMAGMWDSSNSVREDMKVRGLKTVRACSRIRIGTRIHEFRAGDGSHPQMKKILDEWDRLANAMEQGGYVPRNVSFCEEEGEVDPFCCYHTEKLAVCYGIISSQASSPIRISKDIRMCMDCHSSMKLISEIIKREIFVADGCFYHHFKGGKCSCRDRW
ncbi:pentatricopeptide repeat-containing protein-like [Iris pallida]|uniref:Pentatricopeptide repeat-containing protein-like n=1 Tax=Iris pallida TaxID=29817 RepID=A0AAX6FLV6_IRIPA|nr:pentatricopeptide repeat-containing protein-like [Iris pallida]